MKPEHLQFLKLLCSEMNYRDIAKTMGIKETQCHKMAEFLSMKFKVKGRFGLMLFAIKTKLVKPDEIKFKRIPGRPALPKGFEVAIGGTMLLAGKPDVLEEDKGGFGEAFTRNVQKRLGRY